MGDAFAARSGRSALARRAWMVALVALLVAPRSHAQRLDKRTDSDAPYVHVIELYDHRGRRIDPRSERPEPYSPEKTCIKCHDVVAVSHGWHFNAFAGGADRGRPGQPWIDADPRAGTQIPLSARGWPGTYEPADAGFTRLGMAARFFAFAPGGAPGVDAESAIASGEDDRDRWRISGELSIDCMICHAAGRSFRHDAFSEQIRRQNFLFASSAALGLGDVEGDASRIETGVDEATLDARRPKITYDLRRFDARGRVFLDIVRVPEDPACMRCHTARPHGRDAGPRWLRDRDVHARAGLSCADCHRNGIEHHTVRGFEGEVHPAGSQAAAFTCRGCHEGEDGGRLGAPKPLHKGLPPVHLERMSCTACHAGPLPRETTSRVRTSMAHALAEPSQTRTEDDPPAIVEPVYLRDASGRLAPHRMLWPAFFALETEAGLRPLPSDAAYAALRKARVRIREDFREEIGAVRLTRADRESVLGAEAARLPDGDLEESQRDALRAFERRRSSEQVRENLVRALASIQEGSGGAAVYVSGGEAFRLTDDRSDLEPFETPAAEPYAWPIAHDVRPARLSLGARGCVECHSEDAPFFHGRVVAEGPLPDESPLSRSRAELAGYDPDLLRAWELAMRGREPFKLVGVACAALTGLVLFVLLCCVLASAFAAKSRGGA